MSRVGRSTNKSASVPTISVRTPWLGPKASPSEALLMPESAVEGALLIPAAIRLAAVVVVVDLATDFFIVAPEFCRESRKCAPPPPPPPTRWGRTVENWDVSTGPLARPFARSLAPLTHSLRSALLALLARSAAITHSLPSSWQKE